MPKSMPNVSRLLAMMAPVRALPPGATVVADIASHPSGHGGAYRVIRFASGREAAWDGISIRSLPTDWRSVCKWTAVLAETSEI